MSRATRALAISLTALTWCACSDDAPPSSQPDMRDDMTAPDPTDTEPDVIVDPPDPSKCQWIFPDPDSVEQRAQINGWEVAIDATKGTWRVGALRGVEACASMIGGTIASARVAFGAPIVRERFGAYRFDLDGESMRWRPLDHPTPTVTERDGGLVATWALINSESGSGTVSLVFSPHGERDLKIALETSRDDATGGELSMGCAQDEAFFGLGTQSFAMDLRGGKFPLWTQEQGNGKPEGGGVFPLNNIPEAAYAPMGVWHSSLGYTALLGHDAMSELDLCETHEDRVALRSYKAMPSLVLVAGDTPLDRVSALTEYTGRPMDQPDWVFAPWNDAVGGPERLRAVASLLRSERIPSSAIWSEDWIGGEQTITGFRLSYAWEWDAQLYPTLPEDIESLHADGFAFLAYFNTFVPEPTRMFQEGVDGGFLIKNDAGEPLTFTDPAFRDAGLIDLTNPAARDWMKSYMLTAANMGIDGWMADFSEWLPTTSVLHDGSDPFVYHNLYPLDFQRLNTEAMTEAHADGPEAPNNWTFFARSGWASVNGGASGTAATMWAGDQDTNWKRDDGFPTVIPIGTHVGLAGVSMFGTDIAGYSSVSSPNTNKELFYRWSALGSMTPLMRTHHGSDECGNWAFDRDPETLAHYRRYASLHTLLFPYLRARFDEAKTKGWPIMRHPYLHTDDPALWRDDVFFLGADLFVAPVVTPGVTSRPVRLPDAGWWPLFGDAPVSTRELVAQAPATELPAFARPGTILPLLGQVVDSFYGTSSRTFTDLRAVTDSYTLALYPDASGALTSTAVGGAMVSGTDWREAAQLDWATATLNNAPLTACDAEPIAPCVDLTARTILITGAQATLTIPHTAGTDSAQLTLSGATPTHTWRIAIAGDAFGDITDPTPLTDLDPQIPPPCEADEQE